MSASLQEHLEVIQRGTVEIHVIAELSKRIEDYLAGKRGPLKVKVGFDPTRPDLHVGHCVILQKMRQFQELGHHVVFLIGDYTAMVGDPTGQNDMRPRLTRDDVMAAAETYQSQAFKVLDPEKTEVRYNGEWLGKMAASDFIELAAKMTVARILERDDFAKRFQEQRPIYQHELLYPLLQGYDSVALESDIELGGTDQLFNLNVGRDLMPRYGKQAQCVLTLPLLEGLDARKIDNKIVGKKMSKSADNYIGITEEPVVMFRKCMQIDDTVISRYFELLSSRSASEISQLFADNKESPLVIKRAFASEMVTRFHHAQAAEEASKEFDSVYLRSGIPDDIAEFTIEGADDGLWVAKALATSGLAKSSSDGKRLVESGAVELNGERITDSKLRLPKGERYLLKAGSKNRRFAYVVVPK
jgi:tyrosyl-tRNA synthetase